MAGFSMGSLLVPGVPRLLLDTILLFFGVGRSPGYVFLGRWIPPGMTVGVFKKPQWRDLRRPVGSSQEYFRVQMAISSRHPGPSALG
ncbi:hypothetical protein NDU88_005811 [Pleurodeles waltl]|uniref:Uncharacterized protein n=1 Tax=Pleurodeles waltl TaxID=8319 RepID=A0AAV7NQ14_PLEWA|nr:hypothetical protein NDU88_005811 [Pleurodeles waltl]